MIKASVRPDIEVRVRLTAATPEQVAHSVAANAARVYSALGIETQASDVGVRVSRPAPLELSRHPEFFLEGRLCAYDARIADAAAIAAGGSVSVAETEAEYIGRLCGSALSARPELLLNDRLVQAWSDALGENWPTSEIRQILSTVLGSRLQVGEPQVILTGRAGVKVEGGAAAEDYIARQSRDAAVVRLSPELFDQLTSAEDALDAQFETMRQTLFDESGVMHPAITFEPWPDLRHNSFTVLLNDLESPPFAAPAPEERFVDDTFDRLKLMNVAGRSFPNPDRAPEGSVVPAGLEQTVVASGFTVLSTAAYVVQAVLGEFRRNLAVFIHQDVVELTLDRLEKAFPATVKEIRRVMPLWQITAELRELVRDRISIRNLEFVLERMMDYQFSVRDGAYRYTALEDKTIAAELGDGPFDLSSFLRAGLASQSAHAFARGTGTIVVYLVDVPMSDAIAVSGEPLPTDLARAFLKGLRDEMSHLPPTAKRPHILTTTRAATRLRPVIRSAHPDIAVIAYSELPPDTNVQPVARLYMPAVVPA